MFVISDELNLMTQIIQILNNNSIKYKKRLKIITLVMKTSNKFKLKQNVL